MPSRLNQVRIDTQQADALLACDLVVGASADALQTVRHGRTRDRSPTRTRSRWPSRCAIRTPTCKSHALLEKLRFAAGADRVETLDAQALARGRSSATRSSSNIVALGYAWQRGLVPVAWRRCCARSS